MPLTVFTGLPGSGKSTRLIELANEAIAVNRTVQTFACNESPWLRAKDSIVREHLLGSRQQGCIFPLNHFVATGDAEKLLREMPAGSLAAFDEAYHFGDALTSAWIEAARRGVEVLVVTPSYGQTKNLNGTDFHQHVFTMKCERCNEREATASIVLPDRDGTLSVCAECERAIVRDARIEILDRLEKQPPYPGEKAIYQPIDELPECADWRVLRPDSASRVALMTRMLREAALPETDTYGHSTYLDVGCNTGYFCNSMRKLGFHAAGVDVVGGDIIVARLLDSYFRKGHCTFTACDAHQYLHDTLDQIHDVTSAFAVFQWVMIQTSVERGVECLEMLFKKTRRICFLEMGYASEDQYKGKLPPEIDRSWVFDIMEQKGDFAEIRMMDAKKHGLMFGSRDLFIGIKNTQEKPAV